MDLKDLVHEILTSTTMHSDASLAMNSTGNKNSDEMEQLKEKSIETMKLAEERLLEALFVFKAQILTEAKSLNPTPE